MKLAKDGKTTLRNWLMTRLIGIQVNNWKLLGLLNIAICRRIRVIEVKEALRKVKLEKAIELDSIPFEVLNVQVIKESNG